MVETILMGFLVLDVGLLFVLVERMIKTPQQQEQKSEEELLSPTEEGWEYKIVRARGAGFRSLRALQYVCEQEGKFGWILLEKFDDNRLRFRRPVSARTRDKLKQNPYRTEYGISSDFEVLLSVLGTLMILAIPAYLGYAYMRKIFVDLNLTTPQQITAPKAIKPSQAKPNKPTLPKRSGRNNSRQ